MELVKAIIDFEKQIEFERGMLEASPEQLKPMWISHISETQKRLDELYEML